MQLYYCYIILYIILQLYHYHILLYYNILHYIVLYCKYKVKTKFLQKELLFSFIKSQFSQATVIVQSISLGKVANMN